MELTEPSIKKIILVVVCRQAFMYFPAISWSYFGAEETFVAAAVPCSSTSDGD